MCPEEWSGGFVTEFKIYLRKATISVVMSVRPSVGRRATTRLPLDIFS